MFTLVVEPKGFNPAVTERVFFCLLFIWENNLRDLETAVFL
jgi:hypothetical protein